MRIDYTVFSRDGRYAYFGGGRGDSISKWHLRTGKEVRRYDSPVWVESLALSSDGRRLLASGLQSEIRLWDTNSGKELRVFSGHSRRGVPYVAFLPDGDRFVSGGGDGKILLWDLKTGQQIRKALGHEKGISTMDVSPDGKLAVCALGGKPRGGDYDQTFSIRLIDLRSMKAIRRLTGHEEAVDAVAFSPDGKRILSGGWDKTLRLWDVATGREIRKMTGHPDIIRVVSFSPNGRYALSAGGGTTVHSDRSVAGPTDAVVYLWDLESGRAIQRFKGHSCHHTHAVFHPGGQYAVSAGNPDPFVIIWKLPPLR